MSFKYKKYFPFPNLYSQQKEAIDFALDSFLNKGKKFVILEMGTGCHRAGQEILMRNGNTKRIENVCIGDELLGPNDSTRIVLSLIRGHGEMVSIIPNKGDPFVVNIDHILTLVRTNNSNKNKDGEIVDVSVREWLKWSSKKKHLYKLFRSSVCSFEHKENINLNIDPYFLGLLLGDGTIKNGVGITTQDNEILQETKKQARIWDLDIREHKKTNQENKSKTYFLTSGVSQKRKNKLIEELKFLNLYNSTSGDKKIPFVYKTSCPNKRKELLAGLLDSDGHLHNNTFDYVSKSKQLAEDVVFVSRSLGFAANLSKCKKASQNGTIGIYYRVNISGDTDEIPTRLSYKKATKRKQKKNVLRTGFSVKILEKTEDFYGLIVSDDRRYAMGDFTITHNCGKSPVAVTISKYLHNHAKVPDSYEKGSWILTTQKILQDQYVKDFGPPKGVCKSVKSASNYSCDFFKNNKCSDSLHLLKEADPDSKFYKKCFYTCKYKAQKRWFLNSEIGITNFPYFLTETSYVGKILPRQLLIIDECHTIEDELSKFVEVIISERFASTILDLKMPELSNQEDAVKWTKEQYIPSLEGKIAEVDEQLRLSQQKDGEDSDDARRIASSKEKLLKHKTKIDKFVAIYTKENWVFNVIPSWNKSGRKLEFKSIDIGQYAHEHLFKYGEKVLLLSATILNKEAFCESIGIRPEETDFISIDSPFPKENTPVFYIPAGSMSQGNIDKTLPDLAKIVEALIEEHKGEKGIIHTRTFKIANFLTKNIKTSRFLIHDSTNREEILKKHITSKKDTILLSPSSTEGLDLKDDLSRFQIICKIHWPYLGDELVQRRMEKYHYWYPYQAAKSLIQARGRSVRTSEDYAVTYILDDAFERLYSKNINLFPKYFKDSLHMD